MEDISKASWTTPKKRTSLNGRAALKLMRLDGARRAHQAASDARVTKAVLSIVVALLLISPGRKRHRMPVVARPRWEVVVVSNRGL
jgi:hypothetical protein